MGQGPAIGRTQRLDRLTITAEDELANAQADGRCRRPVFPHFELCDRIAQEAELLIVLGNHLHELGDFSRAKGVVREDNIANVDPRRLRHWLRTPVRKRWEGEAPAEPNLSRHDGSAGASPSRCLYLAAKHEPAVGVEPTTPALRMRCSAD